METRADVLRRARQQLAQAGVDSPDADARILLCHAAEISRSELIGRPDVGVAPAALARFEALLRRRCDREPVARILALRAFHDLDLEVSPDTLDPRPDTESVVEVGLALAGDRDAPIRILDLGTGTGAIVLALLKALPNATGVGTDVSEAALVVARRNAERNGVADRVRFAVSDWFSSIAGRYHLIVSNPPYIATAEIDTLEPEVRRFDPAGALDGGADGLDAYRAIVVRASEHLTDRGWLVLEVGYDQADQVGNLAAAAGLRCIKNAAAAQYDLGGYERCVVATTSPGLSKKSLGFGRQSV